MKQSILKKVWMAVLWIPALGCSGDTRPQKYDKPIDIQYQIDESVQPVAESLPGFDEGGVRSLAAVADEDGFVTSFVVNEIMLASDQQEPIDDFVRRYGGEILMEIDPAEEGLPDLPRMALVRVKTEAVSLDSLVEDIQTVAAAEELFGTGELRFSSVEGARLVAAAFSETRAGLDVSLSFVAQPVAIPDSTQEAPKSGGYENAYDWTYWKAGTSLDIGVPEAWSLMHHTNKLNNQVKIAILDGGFAPDDDFRPYSSAAIGGGTAINRRNSMNCTGGSPCPWHGTSVASAAMAIPDNQHGSAGTAGPVGKPVFIYTRGDFTSATFAVIKAVSKGAKIINMSFGADLHWALKPLTKIFRLTTKATYRSGRLLFAAAGNDGRNVDSKKCLKYINHCWEKRFFYPCENPGVVCVGGLNASGGIHPDSNYGDNSLDMWAPFCVNTGPDPDDNGANRIHFGVCGTSLSSPFVAGVAALVWAASPAKTASQVWDVLATTAHGSSQIRKINAYDAIVAVMGTGFGARIISPPDGAELTERIPQTLRAELSVVASPGHYSVPVIVEWYSSLDGPLSQETVNVPRASPDGYNTAESSWTGTLSEGTHVITLITRAVVSFPSPDEEIIVDQDMVVIDVVNPPPQAEIVQPQTGTAFCQGETVTFRGTAVDPNETLSEQAFRWLAGKRHIPQWIPQQLGNGRAVSVNNLPVGNWMITLVVTDSGDATSRDSIDVIVLGTTDPACSNLKPSARIDAPQDDQLLMVEGRDAQGEYKTLTLMGTATDPEDDDNTLLVEWFSSTDGKLGEGRQLTTRVHMTEHCSQSITITLRVTDSDQNVAEDSIVIRLYYVC